MLIQLVDPKGGLSPPKRSYAPRPANLDGLTVGLLSNRKANAENLLAKTAQWFVDRHDCEVLPLERKYDSSRTADPGMLRSIAERSDFLITAAGD